MLPPGGDGAHAEVRGGLDQRGRRLVLVVVAHPEPPPRAGAETVESARPSERQRVQPSGRSGCHGGLCPAQHGHRAQRVAVTLHGDRLKLGAPAAAAARILPERALVGGAAREQGPVGENNRRVRVAARDSHRAPTGRARPAARDADTPRQRHILVARGCAEAELAALVRAARVERARRREEEGVLPPARDGRDCNPAELQAAQRLWHARAAGSDDAQAAGHAAAPRIDLARPRQEHRVAAAAPDRADLHALERWRQPVGGLKQIWCGDNPRGTVRLLVGGAALRREPVEAAPREDGVAARSLLRLRRLLPGSNHPFGRLRAAAAGAGGRIPGCCGLSWTRLRPRRAAVGVAVRVRLPPPLPLRGAERTPRRLPRLHDTRLELFEQCFRNGGGAAARVLRIEPLEAELLEHAHHQSPRAVGRLALVDRVVGAALRRHERRGGAGLRQLVLRGDLVAATLGDGVDRAPLARRRAGFVTHAQRAQGCPVASQQVEQQRGGVGALLARLPLQPRAGLAALLLGGGAQLADQLVDAACVVLDAVELVQL
mmetsp:Transcript_26071/g.77699  ORF Transcript_26071/g.77699 Transcript_26071/m.77699 type:complete len:545 (+) Transcript_26071:801-2435(+)